METVVVGRLGRPIRRPICAPGPQPGDSASRAMPQRPAPCHFPCESAIFCARVCLPPTAPCRPIPPRLQSILQSSPGADLSDQGVRPCGLESRGDDESDVSRPPGRSCGRRSPLSREGRPAPGRRHWTWLPCHRRHHGTVPFGPARALAVCYAPSLSPGYLVAIFSLSWLPRYIRTPGESALRHR